MQLFIKYYVIVPAVCLMAFALFVFLLFYLCWSNSTDDHRSLYEAEDLREIFNTTDESTNEIDQSSTNTKLLASYISKSPVRSFVDCYLHHKITVGDIVVIIRPYYMFSESILQPGDFLRITEIKLPKPNQVQPPNLQLDLVEKHDPMHKQLLCRGILLNHYIDFGFGINSQAFIRVFERQKDSTEVHQLETCFPIDVVSLERNLLKSITKKSESDALASIPETKEDYSLIE